MMQSTKIEQPICSFHHLTCYSVSLLYISVWWTLFNSRSLQRSSLSSMLTWQHCYKGPQSTIRHPQWFLANLRQIRHKMVSAYNTFKWCCQQGDYRLYGKCGAYNPLCLQEVTNTAWINTSLHALWS